MEPCSSDRGGDCQKRSEVVRVKWPSSSVLLLICMRSSLHVGFTWILNFNVSVVKYSGVPTQLKRIASRLWPLIPSNLWKWRKSELLMGPGNPPSPPSCLRRLQATQWHCRWFPRPPLLARVTPPCSVSISIQPSIISSSPLLNGSGEFGRTPIKPW